MDTKAELKKEVKNEYENEWHKRYQTCMWLIEFLLSAHSIGKKPTLKELIDKCAVFEESDVNEAYLRDLIDNTYLGCIITTNYETIDNERIGRISLYNYKFN